MADHGVRSIESAAALSQRPAGMTLAQLADVLEIPLTSAQRAIMSLQRQYLVVSRDRILTLDNSHPATAAYANFALRYLPPAEALRIVYRANPAVEFAGTDRRGDFVVASPYAEPGDLARLSSTIEHVNDARDDQRQVEVIERTDLRDRLLDEPEVRRRGMSLTVLKGSPERTFRDPHRHGSLAAPALGRLHPSLAVSKRAIADLARRHKLARLSAFGSAVHADFRPDSDVDILIEPAPDAQLRVADLLELTAELESLFGRDVDLVRERALSDESDFFRNRVLQDQVVLFGPA